LYNTTQNGYVPRSLNDIFELLRDGINEQFGTSYTAEEFEGTNLYKYFYVFAQMLEQCEVDTSQIFEKLKDYIATTNEKIAIPKTPVEGLIEAFSDLGFVISVKPQTADDAGTLSVCVDVDETADDYSTKKATILQGLCDYTVAGLFCDGTETGNITLSNNQVFEFAYFLPTRYETNLKLTITLSGNTPYIPDSIVEIKSKLIANIKELYRLGLNFEPAKYYTISRDVPQASSVLLQYKNSATSDEYVSDIFVAEFQDLFEFSEDNIEVVIV
jgi:hypothetical protein